jgi:fluoroquinolone transport system permease protein
MVLNDPSIIGFFFIALAVYTEIRHQILSAIFVSPVNIHIILITKTLSLSIIGALCAFGLAVSVKGIHFDIASYVIGTFGICLLSTLLGIIVLTFASEFLKFVILSIPIFLFFINLPLLQYLGAIDMGFIAYAFPIQGSVDLIDKAFSGKEINNWYSIISLFIFTPIFYLIAYRLFINRIKN